MLAGIDVSSYQGHVDWHAVAGDGIAFAATKVTGGQWYTNPFFAASWEGIRAAGLVRMAYHFAFESSGGPGGDPVGEAEYFCDTVGPLEPGDLVALDLEDGPGDLGGWALAWLARVEERLGVRPFVYTGAWFSDQHGCPETPELATYPLWLAAYQEGVPAPPLPWSAWTIWQHADDGLVAGVSTPVDLNQFDGTRDQLVAYGLDGGTVTTLPIYNPDTPAHLQETDWDCAVESTEWALYAWGRAPDDDWIEQSMIAASVVDPDVGLCDASGAGLAEWVNVEYGAFGYRAESVDPVAFDDLAAEASTLAHPIMAGGRGWYHWTGVRGYDPEADLLLLANPAPGWMDVGQTMDRAQFERVGPFSMVRLTHPEAEGMTPPDALDYGPWIGHIGTGILALMEQDRTLPGQSISTWLPLGSPAADVEQAIGENGVIYTWVLGVNTGYRHLPA